MREDRLLDRIRAREREPMRRTREDPRRAIDSVLGHLQRILNTREGSVPIAEDFGLPDVTELHENHLEALRTFEKAIRQTVQKFEPRLRAVRVRFVPDEEDPLVVRFQIVGKLATDDYKDSVRFETVMGSDGKISLRR